GHGRRQRRIRRALHGHQRVLSVPADFGDLLQRQVCDRAQRGGRKVHARLAAWRTQLQRCDQGRKDRRCGRRRDRCDHGEKLQYESRPHTRDVFTGRRRDRRGECRRRAEGPRLLPPAGLGHRPDQGERRDRHVVCAESERRARPLSAEVAVTVLAKPAERARASTSVSIAGVELEMLERGGGAPILYLHGGGGIALDLPFIDLLGRDRRIIAPSHPGFGKSSLPDWLDSVDDIAHIYLELMDRLGLTRTDIVGLSIGGWIAADLATKAPERLERLVLIRPGGGKTGPSGKPGRPGAVPVSPGKLDPPRLPPPPTRPLHPAPRPRAGRS